MSAYSLKGPKLIVTECQLPVRTQSRKTLIVIPVTVTFASFGKGKVRLPNGATVYLHDSDLLSKEGVPFCGTKIREKQNEINTRWSTWRWRQKTKGKKR